MIDDNDADILMLDATERVRTVTLNRPKVCNALSSRLRDRFFAALRDAEADGAVDVVIAAGTDPAFCVGLDRREIGQSVELPDIAPQWLAMIKPVIGAIMDRPSPVA